MSTNRITAWRLESLDIDGRDHGSTPTDETLPESDPGAKALSAELRVGADKLRRAREDLEAFRSELATVSLQLQCVRAQLSEIGAGLSHLPPAAPSSPSVNGFRAEDVGPRLATLSHRERQVMDCIVSGEMNKNISTQLGISQRTVEHHRQSLMRKMGVRSVATLVRQVGLLAEEQTIGAPHDEIAGDSDPK